MQNIGILGCAVALVSLVGCGSGTTTGEAPHGVLAADAGTMGKALDDGTVLSSNANTARGIENNATTGIATPIASPTVTLGKGTDGKFTMTLNGEAVTFDGTDTIGPDQAPFAFEQATANGGSAKIMSDWLDDFNDLGDPADIYYSYPIRASLTQPDGTETFVYAVLGTETLPSKLSSLPAATYVGGFILEDFYEVQPGPYDNQVAVGDFNMLADFARGEVSGTLSNFYFYNPSTGEFDDYEESAYLTMESSAIVGNGYAGNLLYVRDFSVPNETFSGGYSGTFYGPSAEEAGGVFWFTYGYPDENNQQIRGNGVGAFNGDLQQ